MNNSNNNNKICADRHTRRFVTHWLINYMLITTLFLLVLTEASVTQTRDKTRMLARARKTRKLAHTHTHTLHPPPPHTHTLQLHTHTHTHAHAHTHRGAPWPRLSQSRAVEHLEEVELHVRGGRALAPVHSDHGRAGQGEVELDEAGLVLLKAVLPESLWRNRCLHQPSHLQLLWNGCRRWNWEIGTWNRASDR